MRFQPACAVPLSRAMRETFGTWDQSIWDWPLYLCQHFGRKKILNMLDQLEKTEVSETEREKIEAWRLWMSSDEAEKAVAPRN